MNILSMDDAIEELAFAETDHAQARQRKQAVRIADSGIIAFVSTEYDDAVVAGARFDFAEELIRSAISGGKLRLLARDTRARPKNSVSLESVELEEVDIQLVRDGTLDRIDGELVLMTPWEKDESESIELVDLHLFEEEFAALARDLLAYRRLQTCYDYGMATYRDTEPSDALSPTSAAETECASWFREQAKAAAEGDFAGKRAMWTDAKGRFPRLSYRGFIRVWDQFALSEWKKAGRKPARNAG
jgi:hypothetical protein